MQSTSISSILIEQLTEALSESEAILIGAGAGLSTSAGFTYSGERDTELQAASVSVLSQAMFFADAS